ncbi:MAG: methyltransferase domain-containing protein [Blastochloris sp.]|nr:methyltransferase domain-containing protein [Blastochloris sp.]
MYIDSISLLCCPADGGLLECEGNTENRQVINGALVCKSCGQHDTITDGVALLYVNDEAWQPKAREAAGWIQLFRDTAGYGDNPDDYALPYLERPPWDEIAPQFDLALELAAFEPDKRVLDLGAARGWAARDFARRGCPTFAVDVIDDPFVGVGRAFTLAAQDGAQITPVVADGENLPFAAGSLDIVFCAATLHHATNLQMLLQNIQRVLRPGGVLIAINEPIISDAIPEHVALSEADTSRELSYGINETRPHLDGYRQALQRAGLREQRIFSWQAYRIGLSEHLFRTRGGTAIIFAERPTW